MQPDRLAVELRPRGGWEALDLGFQMAREWWRTIWASWLALYLPAALLAVWLIGNTAIAVLVLWWLKPLFDRVALHAASRAVFGEMSSARDTLRTWRQWIGPGLLRDLTFFRVDTARSFSLPVSQLERQKGREGSRRRVVLGRRARGTAVWLTLFCAHVEVIAMYSLKSLAELLAPAGADIAPQESTFDLVTGLLQWLGSWSPSDAAYYVAAVTLVEPLYVSAGFALYLNRRSILEGWDIELALRRMEERRAPTTRSAAAALAAATLAVLLCAQPETSHAQDSEDGPEAPPPAACPAPEGWNPQDPLPSKARDAAAEVFTSPEFARSRPVTRWHYLGSRPPRDPDPETPNLDFWENLSRFLGQVGEKLTWIAAAVLIVLALYLLRRFAPHWLSPRTQAYRPPDAIFGLDVTPQSLPADVAGSASALVSQGRVRDALSLLYRGALSALVHRHQIALHAGDTEGDCLGSARRSLPAESSEYFARLVQAWQDAAWASRRPDPARVQVLCSEWTPHFGQAAP